MYLSLLQISLSLDNYFVHQLVHKPYCWNYGFKQVALEAKKNGVYNVGSGQATSFNKIVEELNKNLKTQLKPWYMDNPYKHYQNATLAELSKAQKFLGYKAEYSIEKGIADYITFLENERKN